MMGFQFDIGDANRAAEKIAATEKQFEVAIKVVVPAAISSIIASFVLAISRAVGETMIVALAAGSYPNLTLNPILHRDHIPNLTSLRTLNLNQPRATIHNLNPIRTRTQVRYLIFTCILRR